MAGGVVDRDLGWRDLLKSLGAIDDAPSVYVGVSGAKNSSMVVIAASNEFGTEDGHIPERSFIRSTIDAHETEILDDLTAAVTRGTHGYDMGKQLGIVGEKYVGKIKERISDRIDPPNAPSTIARKGSDVPLIDQGRLRNSITWEVK